MLRRKQPYEVLIFPIQVGGVRFNDIAWKEKSAALMPLGLNCMLNPKCMAREEMQLRPFSKVVRHFE